MTRRPPAPDRYASTPAQYAVVLAGVAAVFLAIYAITTHWPVWVTALLVGVCAPVAGLGFVTAMDRLSAAPDYYAQAEQVQADISVLFADVRIPYQLTEEDSMQRIRADEIEQALARVGHEPSEWVAGDWEPGYRCVPDGPRAVRVFHDGYGETSGLADYTDTLRAAGYHVISDDPHGGRHRLIVTRP